MDEGDNVAKVVEAIKLLGPRNVSAISRLTGIPTETCRYIIKNRLPKAGISIHAVINYEALGLTRVLVKMEFPDSSESFAPDILDMLARTAYLTYYGRIFVSNFFITIFTLPVNMDNHLIKLLDVLKELNLIKSFEFIKLDYTRIMSMDPSYFDFLKKCWKVPWDDINIKQTDINEDYLKERVEFDYVDVLILKELQKDGLRSLIDIARSIGMDRNLITYHYNNHVIKRNLIRGYCLLWFPKFRYEHINRLFISYNAKSFKDLKKFKDVVCAIPYTYSIALSNNLKQAFAFIFFPPNELNNVLRFLTLNKINHNISIGLIDPFCTNTYSIPFEMFDAVRKRWHMSVQTILETLKKEVGLKK